MIFKNKARLFTLISCAGLTLFTGAAQAIDYPDLRVSRVGDIDKNCYEVSHEIKAMEQIITENRLIQQESRMTNTGVGVAKTVASYFVGSLGGAIGIMAAGYIVNEATDDREEDAMALEDIAAQRRSFMVGVYNAKGCVGPLDLASIEPAAGNTADDDLEITPRNKNRTPFND